MDQAEKDPAQILEDAADLLLIRGVRRDGTAGIHEPSGPLCAYGAVLTAAEQRVAAEIRAFDALEEHLFGECKDCGRVFDWNDKSGDDFEVIDTLRLVAKQLRNGE